MIKPICKDILILQRKSVEASKSDVEVGKDLYDTLAANIDRCVGMAANMIGINKNIIVFVHNNAITTMYNPVIVKKSGEFKTKEGCLSLSGEREVIRFNKIVVEFNDPLFRKQTRSFSGFTAQIIQHECDHCQGIII